MHACEELPEIIAAIESDRSRLDSVGTISRLVDWKPTGKSVLVCALLHATDIGGRWIEVVAARLKQIKYRSGKNRRREPNRRSQLGIFHEESTLIRNRIDTLTDATDMHRYCLTAWLSNTS